MRAITRSATLAAAASVLLLAACAEEESNPELSAAIEEANAVVATGEDSVSFELTDMDGTVRQSSEWNGKPMLVNFWATWCAPCRREIPLLKDAQDTYTDIDLQVIGIAVDFQEDVVAYAEEAEFNYPILVGQEDAMAVAETSGIDFIGLPFTMVLSASGELIKNHVGEIHQEHIDEIVAVFGDMQNGGLDLAGARERLGTL